MNNPSAPQAAWLGSIRIAHILALGVLIRLAVFAVLPDQHFADAAVYVETGRALATTGVMSSPIYMPLYPLWTWLWGGAWGVKIGDIFLSTLTIWLVWRLAAIVTKDQIAALCAAAVSAVYPHFLFYAVSGLSETLFTSLLVAAYLCFYLRRFAYASVLLVLSILVRPTVDLLAPILVALFAVAVHRMSIGQAACRVGQYVCIYLVLMAPWWVHNYARYDQFVRLDLGAGAALYAGNNPLNVSGGGIMGGQNGSDVDWSPFASITDPVSRNEALEQAAWHFIKGDPGRFLELAGKKFVRFWRLWPYAGEYEKPWIVVASLLSYGPMLLCAIVYIATQPRQNLRALSPILALILYLTLVHMVIVGSIRYRFPLEPFLVILGSAEIARWGCQLRMSVPDIR